MTGYIGQVPGQGQIQYFTFTATAGQTTFSGIDDNKYVLNYDVGFCDVFLNGRRLTPNSDYTATNGSTVVLQSAASLNDVIFIASASTFSTANWVTNAINYVYIATAGQTTFTGGDSNGSTLSYVNGTILVSVNGINLPQSDYTATNGSTVVLNSGVNAGDIVQIFSLRTMAVSNFLPLTGGTISGSLTVGNSSVNTYITAGNIALNGSTLLIGNSSANVVINGSSLVISNSTTSATVGLGPATINSLASNTFTIGSATYFVANGNVGIGTNSPSFRLQIGTNSAASTTTPETLSLGGTYSSVAGDNAKVRLWTDGTFYMGIGVSADQIDYIGSRSIYNHVFYIGGNEKVRVSNNYTKFSSNTAVDLNNSFGGTYLAALNVSQGQGGASTVYREIDFHGGWAGGEAHAITATHSSSSTNIVGQMAFQHDGPGSRIRWGKLYHSGDSTTFHMDLISESTTSAYLQTTGSMRAPIFYDSDNTGYYCDPASTSNFNALYLAGSRAGYPTYTLYSSSYSVNTWYTAPENLVVTISLQGSYMNGLRVYAGPTTSTYYNIMEWGDDINSNTKSAGASFMIKKGACFYFESPGPYAYSYETIRLYSFALT